MLSAISCIPRPGLALGQYPERVQSTPNTLDDMFSRAKAHLTSSWDLRDQNIEYIVGTIDQAGLLFEELSDTELRLSVSRLRTELVYTGWNDEHAVKSFAAVRELSDRVLGMRHFESQLIAGWVMYQGKIAEMQTGEGKTLAATLPASTVALSGVPVHIITANDYLATRDATLMRPLYEALGLSVGIINEGMDFDSRCAAYACDITYCTNKQICFDYLRDRVELGSTSSQLQLKLKRIYDTPVQNTKLMLRGLCFAIVDEADSVLIDDARTPLVLSHTVSDDASMHVMYRQALQLAGVLVVDVDYSLGENNQKIELTATGATRLSRLAEALSHQWRAPRRREELVLQALSALHLYLRDRDYLIRDNEIKIVDVNTGRLMADRSWERGLHQMIETKENCSCSDNKETLARISYQRFFRRYLKLSGMSGTVNEVKRELSVVYGVSVVRIQPRLKSRRRSLPECVYLKSENAHNALIESARVQADLGRPVLIGTRSVLASEHLAQRLEAEGLDVQVLNAHQDAKEATIISEAGKAGKITVATNMAGRGTDILLDTTSELNGGLHVILSERNDAARVDRQLFGRCGRQGNPGSYQRFASLEDDVPEKFYGTTAVYMFALIFRSQACKLPGWLGSRVLDLAQRRLERQHERVRRQLQQEDERIDKLLSFAGSPE